MDLQPGDIFAIPLFLQQVPTLTDFKRQKFQDRGKEFAFCRLISSLGGGGYLFEVFNFLGSLQTPQADILESSRLFPPIAASGLGIKKERWKRMYGTSNYDRERDSQYSEIGLVLGEAPNLRVWNNGTESPISDEAAANLERWVVWLPPQLEQRIHSLLCSHMNS